ncbi:hypothetical protein Taro_056245 [Colocasia esculenta]|uniref:Uncharacterized protein n=1 Tax=Colocasia esculenta TaxID=4460 RepID=A0A843XVR4_COLES|nr:hypothetical protein [Colocasia esculenta]
MSQIKVQVQQEGIAPPRTCKKATLNSHYKRSRLQLTLLATHGATNRHHDRQELQQSRSKTTLQSSKAGNTNCRELQSSGTERCHDPQPESGPTRLPQNQRSQTQCDSNPRHTPAETKNLTEHRSNHVRPESHNTSTNIPDLHEARPPQTSTRSRAHNQNHPAARTLHEVRELCNPRGQRFLILEHEE